MKKVIKTNSRRETQQLAEKFSHDLLLRPKKSQGALVVGLKGDLGSGKTTFVQGFARGLGITEKVLSPTFVIIKKFEIRNSKSETNSNTQAQKSKTVSNFVLRASNFRFLYHIDCYRIKDEHDLLALGWDKIVADPKNLVLIEWPDRIKKFLPKSTISISFETLKTSTPHVRKITFS